MRFPVLFSSSVFEVVEANLNLQKLGQLNTVTGTLDKNTTLDVSKYPVGYSPAVYGGVLLQWSGSANAGLFGCYNQPTGQDCISFQLRVKAGATGVGAILIPSNSNLFYRQAMNNPADGNTVYTMTEAECPMTFTPAAVNTQLQLPDIAVFAGSTTVIDRVNGFIYGLKTNLASLDSNIVPVGGATIEVIKSMGSICGTGTVVNVLDNGTQVKTFTVVIFGDVNGDGNIDSMDAGMTIDHENGIGSWDSFTLKAGNVNSDTNVDNLDAGLMVDTENALVSINQITGLAS